MTCFFTCGFQDFRRIDGCQVLPRNKKWTMNSPAPATVVSFPLKYDFITVYILQAILHGFNSFQPWYVSGCMPRCKQNPTRPSQHLLLKSSSASCIAELRLCLSNSFIQTLGFALPWTLSTCDVSALRTAAMHAYCSSDVATHTRKM